MRAQVVPTEEERARFVGLLVLGFVPDCAWVWLMVESMPPPPFAAAHALCFLAASFPVGHLAIFAIEAGFRWFARAGKRVRRSRTDSLPRRATRL